MENKTQVKLESKVTDILDTFIESKKCVKNVGYYGNVKDITDKEINKLAKDIINSIT